MAVKMSCMVSHNEQQCVITYTSSDVVTDWAVSGIVRHQVLTKDPALVTLLFCHTFLVTGWWHNKLKQIKNTYNILRKNAKMLRSKYDFKIFLFKESRTSDNRTFLKQWVRHIATSIQSVFAFVGPSICRPSAETWVKTKKSAKHVTCKYRYVCILVVMFNC